MEKGEFELPEMAGSGSEGTDPLRAALVFTQSWCPQWKAMKNYLGEAEKSLPGLKIFYVEYDLCPFYEDFMAFKENTWQNREIPYVRYYKNGICGASSNYVSLDGFLQRLQ